MNANEEFMQKLSEMEEQYEKVSEMFEMVKSDNMALAEERELLFDELKTSMEGIKELKN